MRCPPIRALSRVVGYLLESSPYGQMERAVTFRERVCPTLYLKYYVRWRFELATS